MACAREWVSTWTPVRTPVVNVHEYFQQVVGFVYGIGGAPLLVAFKAALWAAVFWLFLRRSHSRLVNRLAENNQDCQSCHTENDPDCQSRHTENDPDCQNRHAGLDPASLLKLIVTLILLFIFRYHFEIRPVLFSLIFLGIYWNVLPILFHASCESCPPSCDTSEKKTLVSCSLKPVTCILFFIVLLIQWFWCKCQGLYILGTLFALLCLTAHLLELRMRKEKVCSKNMAVRVAFVLLLFAMPFLHREGLSLFLYPFGLLDRLLGLTPSAAVFASEIAENRSPVMLLLAGENVLESLLMIVLCAVGIIVSLKGFFLRNSEFGIRSSEYVWLGVTTVLAFVAERNFVLFLPVLLCVVFRFFDKFRKILSSKLCQLSSNTELQPSNTKLRIATSLVTRLSSLVSRLSSLVSPLSSLLFLSFLLGLWARSLSAYDYSMIAYQRVPVDAAHWMLEHPHQGRLFNDDRAGGYLAFVNPADSIYIDGRFILKTADFFERYLEYANNPAQFVHDADSLNIDRAIFPIRYYARWDNLLQILDRDSRWHLIYRDEYFVVLDKN